MAGWYALFESYRVDKGRDYSKPFNRLILIDPGPEIPKQRLSEYKLEMLKRMSDPRFIEWQQSEEEFTIRYMYAPDTLFTFVIKIEKWSQAEYDAFRFFDGV